MARGLPTAVTLAAPEGALAAKLAQAISAPHFRPYHSTDVRGVEIGGAIFMVLLVTAAVLNALTTRRPTTNISTAKTVRTPSRTAPSGRR